MEVSFHAEPANIDQICADLKIHGVVHITAIRPNFRQISVAVCEQEPKVHPLAVQGPDGEFHNFLFNCEEHPLQPGVTETRVLHAILAWQAAGEPIPHFEPA